MANEDAAILNWLNEDLHATGAYCSLGKSQASDKSSSEATLPDFLTSITLLCLTRVHTTSHKVTVPKNTLLP